MLGEDSEKRYAMGFGYLGFGTHPLGGDPVLAEYMRARDMSVCRLRNDWKIRVPCTVPCTLILTALLSAASSPTTFVSQLRAHQHNAWEPTTPDLRFHSRLSETLRGSRVTVISYNGIPCRYDSGCEANRAMYHVSEASCT